MTTHLIMYILLLPSKLCILRSVRMVTMLRAERPRDRGFTSCKGESYVPSRKLSDRMWVALNRHVTVNAGYFLGDIAAEA